MKANTCAGSHAGRADLTCGLTVSKVLAPEIRGFELRQMQHSSLKMQAVERARAIGAFAIDAVAAQRAYDTKLKESIHLA